MAFELDKVGDGLIDFSDSFARDDRLFQGCRQLQ
jgi:hypothetical protein